jgi:hypothetical protein
MLFLEHLNAKNPMVEFRRPATTSSGVGGKHSMSQQLLNNNFNYIAATMHRKSEVVSAQMLPKFRLPRTTYMMLPGNRLYVIATQPLDEPRELSEMLTGDNTTDKISVLKVITVACIFFRL